MTLHCKIHGDVPEEEQLSLFKKKTRRQVTYCMYCLADMTVKLLRKYNISPLFEQPFAKEGVVETEEVNAGVAGTGVTESR